MNAESLKGMTTAPLALTNEEREALELFTMLPEESAAIIAEHKGTTITQAAYKLADLAVRLCREPAPAPAAELAEMSVRDLALKLWPFVCEPAPGEESIIAELERRCSPPATGQIEESPCKADGRGGCRTHPKCELVRRLEPAPGPVPDVTLDALIADVRSNLAKSYSPREYGLYEAANLVAEIDRLRAELAAAKADFPRLAAALVENAELERENARLADLRFLARDKAPHQAGVDCPTWHDGQCGCTVEYLLRLRANVNDLQTPGFIAGVIERADVAERKLVAARPDATIHARGI